MNVQYGATILGRTKKNYSMIETKLKPSILITNPTDCYTLVMIDPDAGKQKPNDPRPGDSDRYFLHWLVVNISGGDLASGRTVVSYKGPSPPPKTGKHEYMFLLYKQACGLTNAIEPESRANWSLESFLEGKVLTLVSQVSMYVASEI